MKKIFIKRQQESGQKPLKLKVFFLKVSVTRVTWPYIFLGVACKTVKTIEFKCSQGGVRDPLNFVLAPIYTPTSAF